LKFNEFLLLKVANVIAQLINIKTIRQILVMNVVLLVKHAVALQLTIALLVTKIEYEATIRVFKILLMEIKVIFYFFI